MAMVRSTLKAGDVLTPEQIARIDAAAKRKPIYDPECPPLTDEQLAEFRPVNGMTMEERYQEMRVAGIVDPELKADTADHQSCRKGA
jgi:nucleoside phosphorylase